MILSSTRKSFPVKTLLLIVFSALLFPFEIYAQSDDQDLKQVVTAFKNDFSENFDLKYLNISERELGAIDKTTYDWKDEFMLKSKDKMVNNIGNNSHFKFYFSVYSYETLEDRQYALSDWLKDFINGEELRPGRDLRSFDGAKPTIILINDHNIVICNYDCSDYTDDNFKQWKDRLMQYFGNDKTMVIEIHCDGPLEWTKNAPDLHSKKKMFWSLSKNGICGLTALS